MPSPFEAGTLLKGRYRIEGVLGKGGAGITYRAVDLQGGHVVALKALSLRGVADWKALELFQREAEALQRLSHPLIPRYLDHFELRESDEPAYVLVQSLAPGRTLAQYGAEGWRPTEAEARDLADQVLGILVYLQSLSPPVIHRDIKPSNLLRDDDGTLYLVDFGAVRMAIVDTTRAGSTVVGTYGYMAPEQFMGKATPSTDGYGLGTTLIHLLSGTHPVDLPQRELRIDFSDVVAVSGGFFNWLSRITSPTTEGRYASAADALAALHGKVAIGPPRPDATLISLTRCDGTLSLHIPRRGWSDSTWRPLLTLFFGSALWFSTLFVMRLWNVRLTTLFSLLLWIPFCVIYGSRILDELMGTTEITLDEQWLTIEKRVWGTIISKRLEPRQHLSAPSAAPLTGEVALLTEGGTQITVVDGLTDAESKWISGELLAGLAQ